MAHPAFPPGVRWQWWRLGVIKPDHIAGEIGNFTVNQHHRQGRLLQAVQAILTHADRVDHDALHLVAAQQVEVVQLLIQLIIRITHQQGETFFPTGRFNAAHHIDRVGIGDIGDDQADKAGSAVLEAAGHQAGAIVEFGNGFSIRDNRSSESRCFSPLR